MTADAHTRPGFVLVVDDDNDIREMMEVALELEGFRVATASNGAEAMGLLRQGDARPDLIILDLMMPIMNGYEFRAEQLQDPDLARIPVLILTGFGNAGGEASKLGVAAGLDKPLSIDLLESTIRRVGCSGRASTN